MGICIAAAQSPSIAGDIEANVAIHLRFVEAAHAEGMELYARPGAMGAHCQQLHGQRYAGDFGMGV